MKDQFLKLIKCGVAHMHLRSRNTIPSGSRVPSQVLTHSNSALPKARLGTFNEEHRSLSKSESIETHSMLSNSVQPKDRRLEELMAGIDLLRNPKI